MSNHSAEVRGNPVGPGPAKTITAGGGTIEEGAAGLPRHPCGRDICIICDPPLPEPRRCALCGVRLVPDGSRYCSQAHREEGQALGDIEEVAT